MKHALSSRIALMACLCLWSFPSYAHPLMMFPLSSSPPLTPEGETIDILEEPDPFMIAQAAPLTPEEESINIPKEPDRLMIAEATPLTPEEMQDLRAGFIDPTGLIYNFAVNVRTALNGADVFTRYITVSPSIGGSLQATTATALAAASIPEGLSVNIIGGGKGIFVVDANGDQSLILNQTPGGAPTSTVLNTISNSSIRQSVDMALTLNQLTPVMALARTPIAAALEQSMALRSLGFR